MSKGVKQGLSPVPRLADMALFRYLGSVRNILIEIQQFVRLFAGLSDKQQRNLLAQLRKLASIEQSTKSNLNTLQGQVEAIQGLQDGLSQHDQDNQQHQQTTQQEREQLRQRLDQLQQALNELQDTVRSHHP